MRYYSPMRALRFALAVTLAALPPLAVPIASAQEAMPFEIVIPVSPVLIEINDALLDVTIRPGAEPLVRARSLEGTVGEPATFTVGQGGGRAHIARTPTADGVDPGRAIVELVLDPSQPLHVIGHNIRLVVNGAGGDVDVGDEPSPKLPNQASGQDVALAHTYELLDSEADLTGIPSATIVADNSAVHSDRGSGELAAQLTWAGLTVVNHDGGIRIASTDSETTFEGSVGAVEFEIQGGGLRLRDGSGSVQGKIEEGFIATDRWNGTFSLGGENANLELRDGSVGQLKITSSDTVTFLDEIRGNVVIEATGGQITMDSVQGNHTVTVSDGGQLVANVLHGALALNLKDDAYGEVNRSSGTIKADLNHAELKVSGVKSLDLMAESSRATLEGIGKLTGFEARQSEVELDLREASERKLTLSVDDGTSVDLALKAPCKVQVRESSPGGSGVNVTGCEFQMERAGRWRRGRKDINDGRPPFQLIAKVADTGSLRVRGGS